MSDDTTLWPARNVAEYAYCPRLFYLMEVEGIHLASHDTLRGKQIHKRVDKPSRNKEVAGDGNGETDSTSDDQVQTVRSLTLTSQQHHLTATLDLAEIKGDAAVPVEYRKGKPKKVSADGKSKVDWEPWPTDRIQIGLQAILLEEAGYTVEHGILYYNETRQRIELPITQSLREESFKTLADATECSGGPRPEPLVNDPRCIGCSLQPYCMPDEIAFQNLDKASGSNGKSSNGQTDRLSRKKIWPPRDDGIHLVAQSQGTKVSVRGASLRVVNARGEKLSEMPLADVESLSLLGSVQISTQATTKLAAQGIPIAYLSGAGRLVAMVDPLDSVSAWVRRNQILGLDRPERALELSRALIVAKIHNQRKLLMRNGRDVPKLDLNLMAREIESVEKSNSLDTIRGHEGQAAALYFKHFHQMLKETWSEKFAANGRQRRPSPDPVNSVLSLAYTMLVHECTAALRTARLEPTIGGLHVSRPGRPALSLDLMEPFRPLIGDSIAINLFNRGEVKSGHFRQTAAGCLLNEHGRKSFFGAYGRRMSEQVTHPVYEYKLSYRRMIILHARLIAAWLCGEVKSLSFLTTR